MRLWTEYHHRMRKGFPRRQAISWFWFPSVFSLINPRKCAHSAGGNRHGYALRVLLTKKATVQSR